MMKFLSSHTEKTSFSASVDMHLSKNNDLADEKDFFDECVGDCEEDTESGKSVIPNFKLSAFREILVRRQQNFI